MHRVALYLATSATVLAVIPSALSQFPLPIPQRPANFPLPQPNHARQGVVYCWGNSSSGQNLAPKNATNIVHIAAGRSTSYAVRANGRAIQWGYNYDVLVGINPVAPLNFNNVTNKLSAIEAAHSLGPYSYAVSSEGTIVDANGLLPYGTLSNIVDCSFSTFDLLLKADGSVLTQRGPLLPPASVLTNVIDVLAMPAFSVNGAGSGYALRQDGTVVAWGDAAKFAPDYWYIMSMTNIVQISAFNYGLFGLTGDGVVVNSIGAALDLPNQGQYVSISGGKGSTYALILKRDGKLDTWAGDQVNDVGQLAIPPRLGGVFQVAAGGGHNVVLIDPSVDTDNDGMPIGWELKYFGTPDVAPETDDDQDGYSNLEEFSRQRDPRRSVSFETDGWSATYSIETLAGARHELWVSYGPSDWWLEESFIGDGSVFPFVFVSIRSPQLFFKTKIFRP